MTRCTPFTPTPAPMTGSPMGTDTITSVRPAVDTRPELITVLVPSVDASATRSWRKLITAVDKTQEGAFALDGHWLDAGVAYELDAGALVVTCDKTPDGYKVILYRSETGGLAEVKTWHLKGPLGKLVTGYIARRLPEGAFQHWGRRLEEASNRWDGRCQTCRNTVPAGAGTWSERYGVRHRTGQCPPPPPPPEVVVPNWHAGYCPDCGGWVSARCGIGVRRSTQDPVTGSWYRPKHEQCPTVPLPGPPNWVTDWCADCGEIVEPGFGYWLKGQLRHTGACPDPLPIATWQVRGRRGQGRFEVGQVLRVGIDTRYGGHPVPVTAPGYRRLAEGYEQIIAVVIEVADRPRGRQRARVIAAEWDQVADLLAEESGEAVQVRPHPEGFKARHWAERIGTHRPWLAEIVGRDPDFDLERQFQVPQRDYAESNSKGTRGVYFYWTLGINRVYEASIPLNHREVERVFLRATPEGDTVEITREEVEAWLDNAAPWIAS